MEPRPTPFTLVFDLLAADRFPAIRDELAEGRDLGRFLLAPAAVELLRELRPDEGLGDAADDFVAFVHAAYCHWDDGGRKLTLGEAQTRQLIERSADQNFAWAGKPSCYVQVAPRLLWSRVGGSEIHEPLDGWFAIPEGDQLRMVACLGVHPARPGLSVVTATGLPPARPGGEPTRPPFAPQMEGGDTAGLHSVATATELLWLGWGVGLD